MSEDVTRIVVLMCGIIALCGCTWWVKPEIILHDTLESEAFWSLSELANRSDSFIIGRLYEISSSADIIIVFESGESIAAHELLLTLRDVIEIPISERKLLTHELVRVKCVVMSHGGDTRKYPTQATLHPGQNFLIFVKSTPQDQFSCSQVVFNSIWRIASYSYKTTPGENLSNMQRAAYYLIGDPAELEASPNRIRPIEESLVRARELLGDVEARSLFRYYYERTSGHTKAASCFALIEVNPETQNCLDEVCARKDLTGQDRWRCSLLTAGH